MFCDGTHACAMYTRTTHTHTHTPAPWVQMHNAQRDAWRTLLLSIRHHLTAGLLLTRVRLLLVGAPVCCCALCCAGCAAVRLCPLVCQLAGVFDWTDGSWHTSPEVYTVQPGDEITSSVYFNGVAANSYTMVISANGACIHFISIPMLCCRAAVWYFDPFLFKKQTGTTWFCCVRLHHTRTPMVRQDHHDAVPDPGRTDQERVHGVLRP